MSKEEIREDLNKAIKEKNSLVSDTLRMLLSEISNKEKEKKYKENKENLTEEEILEVIISEAKKRKEAISGFEKGGRTEQAEKEKSELIILGKYLPEQISEEEVKKIIEEAIKETSASNMKDMGKVMASLMPKLKGSADGALVSRIVKELLQWLKLGT